MNRETLFRFFRNETSREENFAIQEWAESSDETRRTLLAERRLFDAINLQPDLPIEAAAPARRTLLARRIARRALRIAAVAVLALGTGYLLPHGDPRPTGCHTVTVEAGQRARIALADGSTVCLNAGTTLRYPADFGAGSRTVELDGEGYFEVARDERSPFVVRTSRADIEVLGTRFNVEAYASEEHFATALFEGSVQLSTPDGAHVVRLAPDQKAELTDRGFRLTELDDYNPYLWRNGIIYFNDATFDEIMEKFSRYFDVEIVVRNKQVAERKYTGKFRLLDGLDYALQVLARDASFRVVADREHRRIVIE
ncbi:MAG: FecR domain-containing protein [Alistipes sp.]|nr:FecR domain-containing protein [Alistipes sp.]